MSERARERKHSPSAPPAAAGIPHEVLARAAHELRSPLGTILGWTHMLRRRGGDEEFLHGLDVIEQSVQAQRRVLDNLLDTSRMMSGQLKLHLRALEARDIVDAALEAVESEAKDKSIRIGKVLDLTAGPVRGDAGRLQQVLVILLSNAVKFTPDNGTIEVTVRHAGDMAEFAITDSGRGWDAMNVPPAFRPRGAGTQEPHGGLGLAVARQLVELHGGTLTAESPGEDRGATFTLRLPLA